MNLIHIEQGRMPFHLSHTRMDEISRRIEITPNEFIYVPACTFRHQQLEYRGVREMESDESLLGILLHVAAFDYGRHCAATGNTDQRWYEANLEKRIAEYALLDYEADEARRIGSKFARDFVLKTGKEHTFEVRTAVDRDFEPVDHNAQCDKLAGSWDYLRIGNDGMTAHLVDYKFGPNSKYYEDPSIALKSLQLQTYAALAFTKYPELDEVVGTLWGPRYGPANVSTASFKRETVIAQVKERFQANLAILDAEFAKHGTGDWEARGCWSVCRWCRLTHICPKGKMYDERRAA